MTKFIYRDAFFLSVYTDSHICRQRLVIFGFCL